MVDSCSRSIGLVCLMGCLEKLSESVKDVGAGFGITERVMVWAAFVGLVLVMVLGWMETDRKNQKGRRVGTRRPRER